MAVAELVFITLPVLPVVKTINRYYGACELTHQIVPNNILTLTTKQNEPNYAIDHYVKYMEKFFDSAHFGSSMAAIDLDNNPSTYQVLIGAVHRYRWRLTGTVMAYAVQNKQFKKDAEFNLTSQPFIAGDQMGEQFGSEIVVADFNGDGLDDIAVSAPTWSKLDSVGFASNFGRVYIFIQKPGANGMRRSDDFNPQTAINGTRSGGHFGWVMAGPGDVDKDGFPDLIVAAPFYVESLNERGKVYLFNGYRNGIRSEPSQILSQPNARSFGSSLTTQLGLIGISDFASNRVHLYRFKPAMRIEAHFKQMNVTTLGRPHWGKDAWATQNDLDCSGDANCWRLCIKFNGADVPDIHSFDVTSKLDTLVGRITCNVAENRRACDTERTIAIRLTQVHRGVEKCTRPVPLHYDSHHEDKIQPVLFETTITPSVNDTFVVDPNSATEIIQEISIWKNCSSSNNRCQSALVNPSGDLDPKSIDFVSKSIRGDPKRLRLKLILTVLKDPSFNTKLFITHPVGARFSQLVRLVNRTVEVRIQCQQNAEDFLLTCILGNPLGQGHHTFYVTFYMEPTGKSPVEFFNWHVNNTNDGPPSTTNVTTEKLTIKVRPAIQILAENNQIAYRHDIPQEDFSHIRHVYTIRNLGLVDLKEAKILIEWPEYTNTKPKQKLLSYKGVTATGSVQIQCHKNRETDQTEEEIGDLHFGRVDKDKSGLVDYVSFKCNIYM